MSRQATTIDLAAERLRVWFENEARCNRPIVGSPSRPNDLDDYDEAPVQ